MNKVLATASAAFSALPGMAGLLQALQTPPRHSAIFGSLSMIAGVSTVLLLHVWRKNIARMGKHRVTRISVISFMILLTSITGYLYLIDKCLVTGESQFSRDYGPIYFPLWLSSTIQDEVAASGGRGKYIDNFGPAAVNQELGNMNGVETSRLLTTLLLFVMFCTIPFSASVLFCVPALYVVRQSTEYANSPQ